jgi:hypothetical protein
MEMASKAKTLEDLHNIAFKNSFFVLVPCQSTANPERVLNGTRIVIVKNNEGFDFSIAAGDHK